MPSTTQIQPASDHRLPTVVLGGVPVARLGLRPTLDVFIEWLQDGSGPRRAATANLSCLELAGQDDELRRCLSTADIVTADDEPVVWLSKLRGQPIAERVAGADFVSLLVGEASRLGKRIYFIGSKESTTLEAINVLRERYPKLIVVGHASSTGDIQEARAGHAMAEAVAKTQADLVLVDVSCPEQNLFIEQNLHTLNCQLAIGVSEAFHFIAGHNPSTPAFMRRLWDRSVRHGMCFMRLLITIILSRSFSASF
ncbi:MAG: WecB/TagA/CpsF family glycosyltransferase [Planctomycetota bacterium]|nr:WecB/TagA/CpsF family glycosyltransferase [Planctomycetota bacterium]